MLRAIFDYRMWGGWPLVGQPILALPGGRPRLSVGRSALAIHGMQPAGKVGQASAQCHLLCQVRPLASLGGADALGGALRARRPPGRLLDDRRCLILRGRSGTRASRGPEGTPQGIRPTINAESYLSGKVSDIGLQPSPKGTPGFSPTFYGFVFVRHHAAKPENLGRPRRSRLKPACRLNACPTQGRH